MNTVFIIAGIIILLLVIYRVFIYLKVKKTIDQPLPFDKIDTEFSKSIKDSKGLIYFFSKNCGNCKVQSPIIEKLNNKISTIVYVDTSKHIETAKAFNIMAIPSIIFFSGNKIKGYYVGVKNEQFVLGKYNNV